ncbi:phosphoserine phosphatase SerB [Deltaproteobacteria bacterium TL4]
MPSFHNYFLISIQGGDHPELLEKLSLLLTQFPLRILELNHYELHQHTCLFLLLDIFENEVKPELEAQIQELALQLKVAVQFHRDVVISDPCKESCYILTVLGQEVSSHAFSQLFGCLLDKRLKVTGIRPLDHQNLHVFEIKICSAVPINRQHFVADLLDFKTQHHLDLAIQPDTLFRKNKRLIVFDADMTFIQCEIINELSKIAGKEKEVEAITHQAMNGELDFEQALRRRVAMLKGVKVSDLTPILENLPYTPGVDRLVKVLKVLGYKIGIVSGGFTIFIDHIRNHFRLDYGYANTLEIEEGHLTGKVLGTIVDAKGKARILKQIAEAENITPEQIIAVGDGANDLDMLASSGLGIAFNAKRFLQERSTGSLSQPNLDALLYFLGISKQELDSLNHL